MTIGLVGREAIDTNTIPADLFSLDVETKELSLREDWKFVTAENVRVFTGTTDTPNVVNPQEKDIYFKVY